MRSASPRSSVAAPAAVLAALALAACVTGGAAPRTPDEPAPAPLAFELLGVAEVAKTTPLDAAPVGGLSALAWQPSTGLWYALSDAAGGDGFPARFVTLRIGLAGGRLGAGDVEVVGVTPLRDAGGRAFAPGSVDPEGLALSPSRGTLFVSSEGAADRGVAPWVREVRLDGVTRRELPLPAHYLPAGAAGEGGVGGGRRGVRHNYAFEALALTPDGERLITATEAALEQDGPRATFGVPSRARVLVFDAASGEVLAEHVYETDPPPVPADPGGAEVAGLVELAALEGGRLLALERAFVEGRGNTIRLYETRLAGAEEVTGERRLPRRVRPMEKRRLLDLSLLGVPLDNVEGMALGPALADGRRTLVLVADDNFAGHQRSLVYAFALSGDGIPPVPPAAPLAGLTVPEVQGSAHLSPFAGREVAGVAGVVSAVAPPVERDGRLVEAGGFWIEDPAGDGDPATSDGLWITEADGPGRFAVSLGDRVRVSGRVAEVGRPGELTTTTLLAAPAGVRVEAHGAPRPGGRAIGGFAGAGSDAAGAACPPRPTIDDDGLSRFEPAADGIDFWESLEGMEVVLVDPLAVGPTSRFGEIPLVAAACAPGEGRRTARGGLLVAAGDFHPERLILDDRLFPGPPQVAVGDRFRHPIAGVVAYSFGNYKLLNAGPLPGFEPAERPPERTSLAADPGHLTVATLNVENFSARDGETKRAALARVVVEALGAPAVVALQEVQDDSGGADDGTVTAAATLDGFVAAIAATGGPRYAWRQVDPEDNADGGAPGGNIRVAFLVDPARAVPVDRGAAGPEDATRVVRGAGGGPALTLSPGRIAPTDPAFRGEPGAGEAAEREPSRKPLALEVEVVDGRDGGRPLFLVALHLRSKGGDDPLFGAVQPPRLLTEPQRVAQAEAVAGFVGEILAIDPEARVIVLGDLNDFPASPPLAALADAGLVDLVDRLPPEDRYTYVYEGNSQVLDHLLVSPALAAAEAGVDAVHLHADFPPGERASDHDPLLARFRLPPAPEP